jgi:serine/threonine protein kinase
MLVPGSDGGGEVVKLLDFGLSKRVGANPGESLLVSGRRMLLGTPLYMAPEQARGDSDNIGSPADQFALGAVIYEMLTGRAAFAGDTVETVLYRIAHVEPEPMSGFVAHVSRQVEQVVRRALSKDPAARFPSIGAFFDAFRGAVAGCASVGRDGDVVFAQADANGTQSGLAREIQGSRRRRFARALAVAVGAVSALAIGLSLFLVPPRRSPAVSPPRAAVVVPSAASTRVSPSPGAPQVADGDELASTTPILLVPAPTGGAHRHPTKSQVRRPAPVSVDKSDAPPLAKAEPAALPADTRVPAPPRPTAGSLGDKPEKQSTEAKSGSPPDPWRTDVPPFDKL